MLDRDIERRDGPPEGKALCLCRECGSDISCGDIYYIIGNKVYCEDCVEDCKQIAGEE